VFTYLEELQASQEVIDVGAEGLQGWVGALHPHAGNLALQNAHCDLFQHRGHNHQTLQNKGGQSKAVLYFFLIN